MSLSTTNSTNGTVRDGHHPTGVSVLDKEILRGIPHGSTIAILGDPDGAAELLVHALAATGRDTDYISTNRAGKTVREDINRIAKEIGQQDNDFDESLTIEDMHDKTASFSDVLQRSIRSIGDGNLIIDTFSSLYDTDNLLQSARRIQQRTSENGGLTYLYFSASSPEDLNREEREVLQLVDGVFNVNTTVSSGGKIENRLLINKLRGVDFPSEAQNLVLGRSVTINTTDDIG